MGEQFFRLSPNRPGSSHPANTRVAKQSRRIRIPRLAVPVLPVRSRTNSSSSPSRRGPRREGRRAASERARRRAPAQQQVESGVQQWRHDPICHGGITTKYSTTAQRRIPRRPTPISRINAVETRNWLERSAAESRAKTGAPVIHAARRTKKPPSSVTPIGRRAWPRSG